MVYCDSKVTACSVSHPWSKNVDIYEPAVAVMRYKTTWMKLGLTFFKKISARLENLILLNKTLERPSQNMTS